MISVASVLASSVVYAGEDGYFTISAPFIIRR